MLPSSAIRCKRETASTFPTTSLSVCGRYFSTHGMCAAPFEPDSILRSMPENIGGKLTSESGQVPRQTFSFETFCGNLQGEFTFDHRFRPLAWLK
jgi:hypothetical protein